MELGKNFQPSQIEQYWYEKWEKSGHFSPPMKASTKPFSIHLPPPNITGTLHMGHAFGQTIMDSLIRYHRMRGENTLWLPGTDHAGIATQIVVERQLASQHISKKDLGREAFIEKLWQWKATSGNTITTQMRRIGCSVDWSKSYFTMDAAYANQVLAIFVELYNAGLIYRGKRLVNWDPVVKTALSDIEVENKEALGTLFYIHYPLMDEPTKGLVVATTRPETLLGDTAVAVHPKDKRYLPFIGKTLQLPLVNRPIPVIADEEVDPEFGTGCVKITPAHDFNDYLMAQRHQTPLINILDWDGTLLANAEMSHFDNPAPSRLLLPSSYAGLSCRKARQQIQQDLEKLGCLVKTEPHKMKVPHSDRTGAIIEPMLTNQWFVAVNKPAQGKTLAQEAIKAVEEGKIQFVPANWVNTFNQWMHHIQDWCISRQLWWGHRIPAWYDPQGNIYVAHDEKEAYQAYLKKLDTIDPSLKNLSQKALQEKGFYLQQDEDVLDTWFSSSIVPFATLNWPKNTPEIKTFLPSSVLVTGYEILFFWVARMIMMSLYFTHQVPFHTVYIHGMVRDHEGKKMSKSEGNVIDPVDLLEGISLEALLAKKTVGLRRPETAPEVIKATQKLFPEGIPEFGADALRLTMASYAHLGRSIHFDFKRCQGYRNFCNKLWHAARFVLMHPVDPSNTTALQDQPHWIDRWMTARLQKLIQEVTGAFDEYRLDLAMQALYEFTWQVYCSWYVELAKVKLAHPEDPTNQDTCYTLASSLEVLLRLLHPIAPFITEELWQYIAPLVQAKTTPFIMTAIWPSASKNTRDEEASTKMALLQQMVEAVRQLRGKMQLDPTAKIPLVIEGQNHYPDFVPYLKSLGRLSDITFVDKIDSKKAPTIFVDKVHFMLDVTINVEAEKARLSQAIQKLNRELSHAQEKLMKLNQADQAPEALKKATEKNCLLCQNQLSVLQRKLDELPS